MQAPPSRISAAFEAHAGRTRLIPYLTAGYPSLDVTFELMRALQPRSLAIEIGVPFSDPIADGPDIQRALEWSVSRRVGLDQVLDLVTRYRAAGGGPVILMTYANPVLRHGLERFAAGARDAGVDGLIVSDLPPDEEPATWGAFDAAGLDTIQLVAPTTPAARLDAVLARSRGFVYCLARTGVTGAGGGYAGVLEERVRDIRAKTRLPVGVGFGISTPEHARALRGVADAAIVGAAMIREITRDPERGVVERVSALARELAAALD